MAQGEGVTLDVSKWEAFLRGLDAQSLAEFRKGARRSARELQQAIRAEWAGGIFRRRTGVSAKSIRTKVPTIKKILSGRPIESRVFSAYFVVRLHEVGYPLRRIKGGPVIKSIPGRHRFQIRTEAHAPRHRQIMEETIAGLIQNVTRR